MSTALDTWLEAGRLLEHLPGLHDQKAHGRRFRIPGDRKSGLKKAAKAATGDHGDGHERAHAAHSVADAVDDALAGLDLPEHHKATISRRARAAAEAHGAHPNPRPHPAAPEHHATVDRAVADAEHLSATTGRPPRGVMPAAPTAGGGVPGAKVEIRALATGELRGRTGFVGIHNIRRELGDRYTRDEVDQALRELERMPDVNIVPEENQKGLTQEMRDAALRIGGQDKHFIFFEPTADAPSPSAPTPTPAKATARSTFAAGASTRMPNVLTPRDAITRLRDMGDRKAGEQLLAKASKADLLAILDAGGIPHRKSDNKTALRSAVIEQLIGRRQDSLAIERVVRGGR